MLVNTIGGNVAVTPFTSSTPEQWRADLELNLMTMFRCTHLVLPAMLAQGSGRIINIGSTAGFIGDRFLAVYSAAKGGVHAFTRVLALELGQSGITVNAIAPYGTRSDDPYSDMSSGSRMHPETRRVRPRPGGGPGAPPGHRAQDRPAAPARAAAGDRRRRGVPRVRPGGVRHRAHPPGRRRGDALV